MTNAFYHIFRSLFYCIFIYKSKTVTKPINFSSERLSKVYHVPLVLVDSTSNILLRVLHCALRFKSIGLLLEQSHIKILTLYMFNMEEEREMFSKKRRERDDMFMCSKIFWVQLILGKYERWKSITRKKKHKEKHYNKINKHDAVHYENFILKK